jgi:phosphoribosyl 1,2-cyclic phosphate phosphodiesterase
VIHRRRFTILGCSSSPGVPRITGDWGACDPNNPKNRRSRAAFLVEQFAPDGKGVTTVVVDTGPDFREQMVRAGVQSIDAVLYTHAHADHIHGIDDIRGYYHIENRRIPIHADAFTMDRIRQGFGYCLETPAGSSYPPIVQPVLIENLTPFVVDGPGGPIDIQPHAQHHGDIHSLGFRFGNVAYCSDISDFPTETLPKLQDLDVLIIDALQYRYHPSHLSLEQALGWIETLKPRRAILTHMHTPLDYDTVMRETPDTVEPAYDLMRFECEVETV